MRGLIAIAMLLIVGQAGAESLPYDVRVFHDDVRRVTCWNYVGINKGGISCLPDNQIGSLPQQATPAREAGRASQASSSYENEPLQATPLPQKKGFQL